MQEREQLKTYLIADVSFAVLSESKDIAVFSSSPSRPYRKDNR